MANLENNNPLICDSLGPVTERDVNIISILPVPSGDNWAIVLNDNEGNEIFRMTSALANERIVPWSPSSPFLTDGVEAVTLTNITKILIYTT